MNDEFRDDEVEVLKKMAAERQAYDIITGKLKAWWVWAVVAGALSIYALWDTVRIKVGS